MNRLILKFRSGVSNTQLEETVFVSHLTGRQITCCRGQVVSRTAYEGSFNWTSGVIGMAALFVNTKRAAMDPSTPITPISSDASACVKSFDSSLSKRPQWILDIFGMDSSGHPVCQRLFRRKNPEQKRPGPVEIWVNTEFLPPSQIVIVLDGRELNDTASLSTLFHETGFLENSDCPKRAKGARKPTNTKRQADQEAATTSKSRALLPFLDHYILALSGYGSSPGRDALIERECRIALRLALAMYDCVYVPAVSYVQSPLCRRLVDEHRSQAELGAIRFLTDTPTWEEFFRLRRGEYSRNSSERGLYCSTELKDKMQLFPMHATMIETTRALHDEWRTSSASESFQNVLLTSANERLMTLDERADLLRCAADDLGALAFIGRHLKDALTKHKVVASENRLTGLICDLFFSHFRSNANLEIVEDLAYVHNIKASGSYGRLKYGTTVRSLRGMSPGLLRDLEQRDAESLWELRADCRSLLVSRLNISVT